MPAKTPRTKFLKKTKSETEKKVVSSRVPVAVHDAFNRAVYIADKNGAKLSLSDVIETAMRDAVEEVRKVYDIDCFNNELNFEDKK